MNYQKLSAESDDAMSAHPVPEHIAALAGLFPQVVQEGKVNFEVLRELLGDEVMEVEELFGLQWHGKAQARRHALSPSMGTLRPRKGESKDWDNTKNLYLEGDNLEVLKLLRKAYSNKVKMIYIDPPYNTGKEFVYPDNYNQSMENYLRITQQLTAFKANQESSGRYHTDWLNMMYPRLIVARDLLREDGVIFISIDDHEVDNLKKVCSEIFGENNFVAQFPWRKRTAKSDVPFGVSQDFEWVMCYAKPAFIAGVAGKERKYYSTSDFPNRPWRVHDLTKQTSAKERPNSFFTIINPKNGKAYPANPNRTWAITEETFQDYYQQQRIVFPGDYDFLNISKPVLRYFKEDDIAKAGTQFGYVPLSTLLPSDVGMSQDGTKDFNCIFSSKIFNFPKPISLIRYFIKAATSLHKDAIILDFFSGSSTTAHAVMQLNAEDGGNRQFIMVQLPEPTEEKSEAIHAGYNNICDIAKERIRRAGEKIVAEADLLSSKPDIGFRVYQLDSSNVRAWNGDVDKNDLFSAINAAAEHLVAGRDEEDLLYEILLKQGIELTQDSRVKSCEGKKIYSLGHGQYYACLEVEFPSSCVEAIALSIAEWKLEEAADNTECAVFVVDSAFASDEDKQNFCKILEQHGVASIKAI